MLCEKIENNEPVFDPMPFRALCQDILSRMARLDISSHNVNFRLRGDTICYLAELIQGHMTQFLQRALHSAVHCEGQSSER